MDRSEQQGLPNWDSLLVNSFDGIEPPLEANPYDKLLLAVLMDGIETLKHPQTEGHGGHRKIPTKYKVKEQPQPVRDAWEWLMSDSEDFVLAFRSICEHFGWSHTCIRKQALEAIDKAQKDKNAPRIYRVGGQRRRKRA